MGFSFNPYVILICNDYNSKAEARVDEVRKRYKRLRKNDARGVKVDTEAAAERVLAAFGKAATK